jgi:hypothetical protein
MIYLNEVTRAEHILETGELDKNITSTLFLLGKYYRHQKHLDPEQTYYELDEFLRQNYEGYVPASWESTLERVAKSSNKYLPRELDHVGITRHELDKISEMEPLKHQKILFSLLCHAKAYNLASDKNNGWINTEIPEIYRLANVTVKHRDDKYLYLNSLYQENYISYAERIDNMNIHVNFIDMEGEAVLKITEFRDLGHQYLQFLGKENYIRCAKCGRLVKKTGNRMLYCKSCAKVANAQQDRGYYLAHRKAGQNTGQKTQKTENPLKPA